MTVKPVFLEWLSRTQGDRATRVQQRIRQTRDGQLDQSEFEKRMLGTGEIAKQIRSVFQVFAKKYELDRRLPSLRNDLFTPPPDRSGQLKLF
jgi:DNA repair photolyase